jgi:hypothetical protein
MAETTFKKSCTDHDPKFNPRPIFFSDFQMNALCMMLPNKCKNGLLLNRSNILIEKFCCKFKACILKFLELISFSYGG